MPNNGNNFRHALAEYIRGWGEGLAVEEEKYIGWRFIGTPRKLDIVIMNPQNCRSMAIEAKLQETSGSAFEKLSYALDDCMAAPHPVHYCLFGAVYPGRHEGQADFLRSWY